MTNSNIPSHRHTFANALRFAISLVATTMIVSFTATAYAQSSSGGGGSAINPATSGAGSSNSGTPCEKGCGPNPSMDPSTTSPSTRNNAPNGDACPPGTSGSMTNCMNSNNGPQPNQVVPAQKDR